MIYDIQHVTTYHYGARVTFARCLLHLEPRGTTGQRVISHSVGIEPRPVETSSHADFFGNRETSARFAEPHAKLVIRAKARVEVLSHPALTFGGPGWESVAERAIALRDLSGESPIHQLFGSRHAPLLDQATAYARPFFPPGRPVLDGAMDLMHAVHADFAYDPEATEVSTPLEQVLVQKAGVCQDFAHLMIAGLRGIGVPAAYVSGYLRTRPPPGGERLEGADATHAWVSVWCGQDLGWVDLDPTNDMQTGEGHVVLAIGRDYSDVAPVSGVVLASSHQRLVVQVDVSPV